MRQHLAPFYQYVYATQLPTAGAMAYGFESESMCVRPACGPGIGARSQFLSIMPQPGVMQMQAVAWASGLTGVVHGQTALQPLSNPYGP